MKLMQEFLEEIEQRKSRKQSTNQTSYLNNMLLTEMTWRMRNEKGFIKYSKLFRCKKWRDKKEKLYEFRVFVISNYLITLSMMLRFMQIEVGAICKILRIIPKPNPIIASLLIHLDRYQVLVFIFLFIGKFRI